MTIDPYSEWDGAYVLGALSMDERREYERHFASCTTCAAAVAELAGIPGILTKIDTDSAVVLMNTPFDVHEPRTEPDLLQKLARVVSQQQRRARRKLSVGMSAAAAVLIVLGAIAGNVMNTPKSLENPAASIVLGTQVRMAPIAPIVMTANMQVTSKPWGTRFDWSCTYVGTWSARYSPNSYDLVITDASGKTFTIATWSAPGPTAKGLAATSKLPIKEIRSVEIRAAGSSAPLVRGEI
jgi:hypothetical protein